MSWAADKIGDSIASANTTSLETFPAAKSGVAMEARPELTPVWIQQVAKDVDRQFATLPKWKQKLLLEQWEQSPMSSGDAADRCGDCDYLKYECRCEPAMEARLKHLSQHEAATVTALREEIATLRADASKAAEELNPRFVKAVETSGDDYDSITAPKRIRELEAELARERELREDDKRDWGKLYGNALETANVHMASLRKVERDLARERERHQTLEIPLSSGQVSIIDLEDFPLIAPHKWSATLDKDTGSYYAATYVRIDGKQVKFYMHRVIMGLERGDLRQVDHKEPSETLNNRRSNLRISTAQQNIANCRKQKNNKSGYKGVHWSKSEKKWIAQIHYNRANHTIGRFSTAEDANEAYIAEARRLHGEFARS